MKVAIIGGSGKMGHWAASFLSKDGHDVIITGRNKKKLLEAKEELGVAVASNVEAVRDADYILISIPIESFEEVVREISPHIQPGQATIEITSVKMLPVATMHKYLKTGPVLGVHPLFGPGARSVTNQNFILTPTNTDESNLAQKLQGYLEDRGARVTLMSPQEHDEMMSIILGLSHFIGIVSADALLSSGKMKPMDPIGSISYKVLLTLVESVISEDPELYASIQMNLPRLAEIETFFQTKVREWRELVENKDKPEFARRMKSLKDKLEQVVPDFGKAYENMYKIADEL